MNDILLPVLNKLDGCGQVKGSFTLCPSSQQSCLCRFATDAAYQSKTRGKIPRRVRCLKIPTNLTRLACPERSYHDHRPCSHTLQNRSVDVMWDIYICNEIKFMRKRLQPEISFLSERTKFSTVSGGRWDLWWNMNRLKMTLVVVSSSLTSAGSCGFTATFSEPSGFATCFDGSPTLRPDIPTNQRPKSL